MRWRIICLAAIAWIGLAPGLAGAATFDAQGTLTIEIGGLAPIDLSSSLSVIANGSGGGGHLTSLTIPGSAFATTALGVDVSDPAANPIQGLIATVHNETFAFTGGDGPPNGLGGIGALNGVAKVCLFADCSSGSVPANVSVPLTVIGDGGTTTVSSFVNVTVQGAGWSSGTVNIGTITGMGFAHGPASVTSSTAAPSGVVNLVTPIFISTNIGALPLIASFASLQIHIVPEPGTLLLLGSGVVALVVGRRRSAR